MMMPPMGPPPAGPEQGEELSFEDRLARIVSDARAAVAEDGVDPDEELILEQLTSLVAKIKAKRAKEHQAALGGGPATNFLGRMLGGS